MKQGTIWLLVTWCQCWHHMTLTASSIVPPHLLFQDDQNEMQPEFFSYLTLLILASASCNANGFANSTTAFISWMVETMCNITFGYVMPFMLVSVSHDSNSVINDSIPFLKWKWDATWLFSVMWWHRHQHQYHVMPVASSVPPLHLFSQDNQNKVQHDFAGYLMHLVLALAACDDNGNVSGTTALVSSRWSKWGATWFFLAMWCH